MGRRSKLEELGIGLEDISRAYREFGTAKAVGRKYGISERTIRKYLQKAQVTLVRGRRKGDPFDHSSRFALWLKDHPRYPLPGRVKEIAAVTGLDLNDIKTYLYRRRLRVQRYVETLPNLTQKNYLLDDIKGRKIPSKAIRFYVVSIDKNTHHIIIRALMKNDRPYRFVYTQKALEDLLTKKTQVEGPEGIEPQDSAGLLHRTIPD